MTAYKIIRFFYGYVPLEAERRRPRTIKTGLTLKEAQEHCKNPETSSSTCKLAANVRYTKTHGPWFDGYEEM
jgi:hypothetical protein